MPYLFAHFKEKITPDGEQVYFGISRDGLNWEKVNGGNPVLIANLGEKGCRDIEIVRLHTGGFVILTTFSDSLILGISLPFSSITAASL